ncbi:MAG: hypothetical protein EA365_13875 [Gloeocapsa sp. DLM2.Bin57]|nr:MAG: hypothetical protein EA365_13875 [Gloeocapsa sp. DLM2.Bin57]
MLLYSYYVLSKNAATSGIQKGQDAIKIMMAGAKITQLCSALLRHGIDHIQYIEKEMIHSMEENEYESIKQMPGSMSQINCPNESAFERVQYLKNVSISQPYV